MKPKLTQSEINKIWTKIIPTMDVKALENWFQENLKAYNFKRMNPNAKQ